MAKIGMVKQVMEKHVSRASPLPIPRGLAPASPKNFEIPYICRNSLT